MPRSARKSARKSPSTRRKSARKSPRKSARKSPRNSARKSPVRKSRRKSARKSPAKKKTNSPEIISIAHLNPETFHVEARYTSSTTGRAAFRSAALKVARRLESKEPTKIFLRTVGNVAPKIRTKSNSLIKAVEKQSSEHSNKHTVQEWIVQQKGDVKEVKIVRTINDLVDDRPNYEADKTSIDDNGITTHSYRVYEDRKHRIEYDFKDDKLVAKRVINYHQNQPVEAVFVREFCVPCKK